MIARGDRTLILNSIPAGLYTDIMRGVQFYQPERYCKTEAKWASVVDSIYNVTETFDKTTRTVTYRTLHVMHCFFVLYFIMVYFFWQNSHLVFKCVQYKY